MIGLREWIQMSGFLCRLLGHDHMTTSVRHRICLRCGQRETLRSYGDVLAWEEMTAAPARRSTARDPRLGA
jgi:hypothetical protein